MKGRRCSKLIIKKEIFQGAIWRFWQLCPLACGHFSPWYPHGEEFLFLLPAPWVTLGPAEIRCQSSGQISGLCCSNISLAAHVSPFALGIFFFFNSSPFCSWGQMQGINSKVNTGRFHSLPGGDINSSTWDSFISPSKHLSCDGFHHFIAPFNLEFSSSAITSRSISALPGCQSPIESGLGWGCLSVLIKSHYSICPPSPETAGTRCSPLAAFPGVLH